MHNNHGRAFILSGRPRHYLYVFVVLMSLFTCLFTAGTGWFIEFLTTFQTGILGLSHVITGILIGLFIKMVAVDRYLERIRNSPPADRLERSRMIDFYSFQDAAYVIGVVSVLALMASCFFGYNMIMVVTAYCPAEHATHHIQGNGDLSQPKAGSVTVLVYYDHTPVGEYYPRNHLLQLKYNTTSKEIIRRVMPTDPKRNNEWYLSHNVFHPNKKSSVEEEEVVSASSGGGLNDANIFCANRHDSLYSFLDHELNREFEMNQKNRVDAQTMRFFTRSYDKNTVKPTNEEENATFLDMMVRHMCRNEYAFIILVITMLCLWDTMLVALIGYSIYVSYVKFE